MKKITIITFITLAFLTVSGCKKDGSANDTPTHPKTDINTIRFTLIALSFRFAKPYDPLLFIRYRISGKSPRAKEEYPQCRLKR